MGLSWELQLSSLASVGKTPRVMPACAGLLLPPPAPEITVNAIEGSAMHTPSEPRARRIQSTPPFFAAGFQESPSLYICADLSQFSGVCATEGMELWGARS